MPNTFTLMLTLATLITGIIWCFKRFKLVVAFLGKLVTNNVPTHGLVNPIKLRPNWVENIASLFPMLLVVFVVRSFIYEPFQIPSGSMMPTLRIGDFILVEKYAYGIKNPITQTTLINTNHPKRGDIVVFKYPLNPKLDYIKRVIGLPGDYIRYDPINKRVFLRPSCNDSKTYNTTFTIIYNDMQPSNDVQLFNHRGFSDSHDKFHQIPLSNNVPQNSIRLHISRETLGKMTHSILKIPGAQDQVWAYYQQTGNSLAEWVVPDGHYFMMGDNRDNSADSRYWGFVPEKNLVGKAIAIWMSFEKQEGEWPTGIRFSRINLIH